MFASLTCFLPCRSRLGEESADRMCDLLYVGLQGEVTGVDETNVGVGDVTREGFSPSGQEERVIPAPHREQRRSAGAEVLLELGVERHVARVVEEQVELDLVGPAAGEVVVVEPVAVRTDARFVGDTMRVLPD